MKESQKGNHHFVLLGGIILARTKVYTYLAEAPKKLGSGDVGALELVETKEKRPAHLANVTWTTPLSKSSISLDKTPD